MPFKNERVDLGEGTEIKHSGVTIKTEYDENGKPVRVSRIDEKPSEKTIESSKNVTSRLKGVGAKLSKALAQKKMTEYEIDEAIRITNKKASLQRAKRRLADERRETVRSNINTFGQFVREELPKGDFKKNGGGGGYFGFEFAGTADARRSKPINPSFDYADWMYGGQKPSKQKSGRDWARDFYGL